eukprot:6287869-Amphidinium_carterae.6
MDYKDWVTIVGDVLPVKRHHQHTMAILKCAWFMTLGEKNLYIHIPSSDAKTPVSAVPYDTTEKTARLINGGGRQKLRRYKARSHQAKLDDFELGMTWCVEVIGRALQGEPMVM